MINSKDDVFFYGLKKFPYLNKFLYILLHAICFKTIERLRCVVIYMLNCSLFVVLQHDNSTWCGKFVHSQPVVRHVPVVVRELSGNPVGTESSFGSLLERGWLKGEDEMFIKRFDECPFAPLVARYTVVLLCSNQPVVFLCTSADPWGWAVGELVVCRDFFAIRVRWVKLLISRNIFQFVENLYWHLSNLKNQT